MNEKGFTLIELLIAIGIVGALAVISISQFQEYRERAYDKRSLSDLKNAVTAQEAYHLENQFYATCANSAACATLLEVTDPFSDGVVISFTHNSSGGGYFTGSASHPNGVDGGVSHIWNSASGGLQ